MNSFEGYPEKYVLTTVRLYGLLVRDSVFWRHGAKTLGQFYDNNPGIKDLVKQVEAKFEYEISGNQIAIAINLYLNQINEKYV